MGKVLVHAPKVSMTGYMCDIKKAELYKLPSQWAVFLHSLLRLLFMTRNFFVSRFSLGYMWKEFGMFLGLPLLQVSGSALTRSAPNVAFFTSPS